MFQLPDVNALCFLPAVVFLSTLTKAVCSDGYHVVISTNTARQLEGERQQPEEVLQMEESMVLCLQPEYSSEMTCVVFQNVILSQVVLKCDMLSLTVSSVEENFIYLLFMWKLCYIAVKQK